MPSSVSSPCSLSSRATSARRTRELRAAFLPSARRARSSVSAVVFMSAPVVRVCTVPGGSGRGLFDQRVHDRAVKGTALREAPDRAALDQRREQLSTQRGVLGRLRLGGDVVVVA